MSRGLIFIILKVLVLQCFFYLTAKFAPLGYSLEFLGLGFLLILINFIIVKNLIDFLPYISLALIFLLTGFFQDTILIHFNILVTNSQFPPLWFATLWMVFLCYYGDVFNKMLNFPTWLMSLLGGIGGSLAYYRGLALIDIVTTPIFYPIVFIVWSIFMPFSLKYFKYFKDKKLQT